jgi:hypothetical protein
MYFGPAAGGGEAKFGYKLYQKDQIISGAYKIYGNPELGFWAAKVVISNSGTGPLKNIKITRSIDSYAQETQSDLYPFLAPNGTIVDLYHPLISSEATKLSASTPSNMKIKITYEE